MDEKTPQGNPIPNYVSIACGAARTRIADGATIQKAEMTMAKPALLMTGPMMPLIAKGCEAAFLVHRLWEAGDRETLLKTVAPEIRAICTGGHTGVKTDEALMTRFPDLKIVGNFGVGYD